MKLHDKLTQPAAFSYGLIIGMFVGVIAVGAFAWGVFLLIAGSD
jgi:hypothetical protein